MLHWRIEWASWRRGPSLEGDHGGREGERPRHSAQREQQKLRAGQREAERGQSGWKHEARSRAGVGATGQPDLKGRPRPPRQVTSPLGRVCLRSSPSGVYVSATSSRRPSLLPALTRLEPALSALPVCRALRTPKVRELSITGGHRLPTRHTGLSRSPGA